MPRRRKTRLGRTHAMIPMEMRTGLASIGIFRRAARHNNDPLRRQVELLVLCLLFLMGCAPVSGGLPSEPAVAFVTSTLPATATPGNTELAPTASPTSTPGSLPGTTTTQVNVRAEPASASPVLAVLPPSASVNVVGKDRGGNWYQILLEPGGHATGWVSAAYVNVQDKASVPVADASSGLTASVREQINVRDGPGTNFKALGTLNPRDVVTLTGRDRSGAWLQVRFAAGADGMGWVAASFLEAASSDALPVVDESGEVQGTATPTVVRPAPSPTVLAAKEDGDSEDGPAADARFSPGGAGSISYSSELSAPQGDSSDWLRITPYSRGVSVKLTCTGNGELRTEVLESGTTWTRGQPPSCGETRWLALDAGSTYVLHLEAASGSGEPVYLRYTASVYGAAAP